jgi:hypothetical protein
MQAKAEYAATKRKMQGLGTIGEAYALQAYKAARYKEKQLVPNEACKRKLVLP